MPMKRNWLEGCTPLARQMSNSYNKMREVLGLAGPRTFAASRIFIIPHPADICQAKNEKILHKFLSQNLCILSIAFPLGVWYYNNVRSRKATRRVRSQVDRVSPFERNEHLENNAGQEASKPLQKNKKI